MNNLTIREILGRAVTDVPHGRAHGKQILKVARLSRRRRRVAFSSLASLFVATAVFGGFAWDTSNREHIQQGQSAATWTPSPDLRLIDLSDADPTPVISVSPGDKFVVRATLVAGGVAPAVSTDSGVLRRVRTGQGTNGSSLAEFEALAPGIASLNAAVTPLGSLEAPSYRLIVLVSGVRPPTKATTG